MNVMTNIKGSSIVVQWDAVDDFLPTTYTIIWTDERDLHRVAIVIEQTSYTITGLTLDTVYTITVIAANKCNQAPEFRTSVSLSTDTTSTSSTISPTVTAMTNPTTSISTANSSSSNRSITALINSSTTTNTMTAKVSITTTSTNLTLGTTTDITILTAATTTTSTTTMTNFGPMMTYASTTINNTVNPTNATIVNETSKISSTGNT